jgi:hypothetical protein
MNSLKKPLSAHQFYMKSWKNLTDEEKLPFIKKSNEDKERYKAEKKAIEDKEKEETKKLQIFIERCYDRVPCIGLDNGFETIQVIGPVEKIVEFSEKEIENLKEKFNDYEFSRIPKYKKIMVNGRTFTFNLNGVKSFDVYVFTMGTRLGSNDFWWSLSDKKKQDHYTEYNNPNMMGNKTWRYSITH